MASLRYAIEQKRQPFAALWREGRGRLLPEPPSATRSDYQRDRDRIIHSTAFRRLKHKTQVFVEHEGDLYRTRLTHTIEVAQIARSLARAIGLDEDLAETLALAHDLGHPPFGHTGEDALDALMSSHGGFDHNAQALRIVTRLEMRYAQHDGLNLTYEALEGLVKHNGPLRSQDGNPVARYAAKGIPADILAFDREIDLKLSLYAAAEAQAAAIADDIAYNAHDIDDGLRAGLFSLGEIEADVPFIATLMAEIRLAHGALEPQRITHEIGRRVITRQVEDVIAEAEARLDAVKPASLQDVREAGRAIFSFSERFAAIDSSIKRFLFAHMYRHPKVMPIREKAGAILSDLFALFMRMPSAMGEEWARNLDFDDKPALAVRVCDYIAGMTDRYAIETHRRWFDATPDLR
jgi:dGTPase